MKRVIQVHMTGSPTCVCDDLESAMEEIRTVLTPQWEDEAALAPIHITVTEITDEAYASLPEHQGY